MHNLFGDPETLSSLLDPEKDAKPERGFDFWVSSASALHLSVQFQAQGAGSSCMQA
jgi:hypothetical protein